MNHEMGKRGASTRTTILPLSNRSKTHALPRSSKHLLYDVIKSRSGTSKSHDARRLCGFEKFGNLFEEGGGLIKGATSPLDNFII